MPVAAWDADQSFWWHLLLLQLLRRSKALLFLVLSGPLAAAPTLVTVSGRQLLVDGQAFTVQGVNYSPVTVGATLGTPTASCIAYAWWEDQAAYTIDFPLIKRMGANTIRAYGILNDTSPSAVAQVRAALDEAYEQGLFVIMNYFPQSICESSRCGTASGVANRVCGWHQRLQRSSGGVDLGIC